MKIAVSTPTGKVGHALVRRLLETDNELVLLARNPARVEEFVHRGAVVEKGTLEDKHYVERAIRGADTYFVVVPPNFNHEDYRGYQREIGKVALAAIQKAQTPRVVFVSSVAAHLGEGLGPISGLGEVERLLDTSEADVTYLRANYFMENFLGSAQGIWSDGAVFLPVPGSVRVGCVAADDVGKEAADIIQDTAWSGKRAIELSGPADITFDEAAAMLGKAIGKKVKYVQCTIEQMSAALIASGIGPNVAELYAEMSDAMAKGKLAPEGEPIRGETTFAYFAERVFRPGYQAMTG